MSISDRIRRFENLHIIFWLIKDSCWMLELKWLGTAMIGPTFFLAVYLVVKTVRSAEFFVNLAILCWIIANSFWMLMEFFNQNRYKNFAAIPFALGIVFVGFYFINLNKKSVSGAGQGS